MPLKKILNIFVRGTHTNNINDKYKMNNLFLNKYYPCATCNNFNSKNYTCKKFNISAIIAINNKLKCGRNASYYYPRHYKN
mgnify:CR=1 FL=1